MKINFVEAVVWEAVEELRTSHVEEVVEEIHSLMHSRKNLSLVHYWKCMSWVTFHTEEEKGQFEGVGTRENAEIEV